MFSLGGLLIASLVVRVRSQDACGEWSSVECSTDADCDVRASNGQYMTWYWAAANWDAFECVLSEWCGATTQGRCFPKATWGGAYAEASAAFHCSRGAATCTAGEVCDEETGQCVKCAATPDWAVGACDCTDSNNGACVTWDSSCPYDEHCLNVLPAGETMGLARPGFWDEVVVSDALYETASRVDACGGDSVAPGAQRCSGEIYNEAISTAEYDELYRDVAFFVGDGGEARGVSLRTMASAANTVEVTATNGGSTQNAYALETESDQAWWLDSTLERGGTPMSATLSESSDYVCAVRRVLDATRPSGFTIQVQARFESWNVGEWGTQSSSPHYPNTRCTVSGVDVGAAVPTADEFAKIYEHYKTTNTSRSLMLRQSFHEAALFNQSDPTLRAGVKGCTQFQYVKGWSGNLLLPGPNGLADWPYSQADLMQFAAAVAVAELGGPNVTAQFKWGRPDWPECLCTGELVRRIPTHTKGFESAGSSNVQGRLQKSEDTLRKHMVDAMGLDPRDVVALMGAHTVGGVSFSTSGNDGSMGIRGQPFDATPDFFDNHYFKALRLAKETELKSLLVMEMRPGRDFWSSPKDGTILLAEPGSYDLSVSACASKVQAEACSYTPIGGCPFSVVTGSCEELDDENTLRCKAPGKSGFLDTDLALIADEDGDFYAHVEEFADDADAFFDAFTVAFLKMNNLGHDYANLALVQLQTQPSPQPLSSPTAAPTAAPTSGPTETSGPTAKQTANPTTAPTAAPTSAPTALSTAAPTAAPSFGPTEAPSRLSKHPCSKKKKSKKCKKANRACAKKKKSKRKKKKCKIFKEQF